MFKLSKNSKAHMEGVDSRLIEIANLAIQITPIDFGIPSTGGLRTSGEQFELFADGKSQLDGTHKKSYHQTGKALDFYAYVGGSASWNTEYLSLVGAAFLQAANALGNKLEWGGLWEFVDMPHVQLPE